jgi:hypothetical protein
MGVKNKLDTKRLRADLEILSAQDFEMKYPGLSSKTLKGLTAVDLEQRISKTGGRILTN